MALRRIGTAIAWLGIRLSLHFSGIDQGRARRGDSGEMQQTLESLCKRRFI